MNVRGENTILRALEKLLCKLKLQRDKKIPFEASK